MYVVRSVFQAKPGKGKELLGKFKESTPHFVEIGHLRLLTDVVGDFWTVVVETEVENLQDYFHALELRMTDPELRKALSGYMDLVQSGRREIFRIE